MEKRNNKYFTMAIYPLTKEWKDGRYKISETYNSCANINWEPEERVRRKWEKMLKRIQE